MNISLLLKCRFHTPMIRFIGKRDGLPPQQHHATSAATQDPSGFVFTKQPLILSTIKPISEKSRNTINLGGVASSKDYKSIKPIDILKSK